MPKEKVAFEALFPYLPQGSFEKVVQYIIHYKIKFTVSKARKTLLGDYRPPFQGQGHRISVNGNLNMYSFLITFIHELAHLTTFEQYGSRVRPHGKHWQSHYTILLEEFLQLQIFPSDLVSAIRKTQYNPAASSCSEVHLSRALAKYDENELGLVMVEQLPVGAYFITKDGRLFKKGEKRRTRYFGVEVKSGKLYLFAGVYQVKPHFMR